MNRTAAIFPGAALSGSSVVRAAEPAHSFESRLDDTAYADAVSALPAKRADPAAAAASNFPTWGVPVQRVDSGTHGLAAGITTGSLVDRLNGSEYHYHKQHLDADVNGRREVSWVTPDGVRHDFNFKAGRIGTWPGISPPCKIPNPCGETTSEPTSRFTITTSSLSRLRRRTVRPAFRRTLRRGNREAEFHPAAQLRRNERTLQPKQRRPHPDRPG